MDLREFIQEHLSEDPASLALHRDRWPGIDVAFAADCIAAKRKLRTKVPEWYENPRLIVPSPLSAEQCSSSATALHKAYLAAGFLHRNVDIISPDFNGMRIADLTGGLGIDSWQFAHTGMTVLYNEMNPVLANAAGQNFKVLFPHDFGSRIRISNCEITASNLGGILDDFKPEIVYLDPARRGSGGRKVFRLEDCSPNLLELQDTILSRGIRLMAKLSPVADISMIGRSLHNLKELHVIESYGECKELVALCEPNYTEEYTIIVEGACMACNGNFSFRPSEEAAATMDFCKQSPSVGELLFEPGPALMKSGAYRLLCSRFGLKAIGKDAHFYLAGALPMPEVLGRRWRIADAAPFSKSAIRAFASKHPGCDAFIARGLHISSEELASAFAAYAKSSTSNRKAKGKLFALAGITGKLLLYCVDDRDNNYI